MARKKNVEEPKIESTQEKPPFNGVEFTKEIVKRSRIENFVEVKIIDAPMHEYAYLDFDGDKYIPAIKQQSKPIMVEDFQVSCAITHKQLEELEKTFGIDVNALLNDALINEACISLVKQVLKRVKEIADENDLATYTRWDNFKVWLYKLFKKTYVKDQKFNNERELLRSIVAESNRIAQQSKFGNGNFAVTNIKYATALQENSDYVFKDQNGIEPERNFGQPYQIGSIAGISVFCDPFMTYNDGNIYIGYRGEDQKPGIKVLIYVDGTTLQMIAEGVGAPKLVLKMRYAVVAVGPSSKKMYRKIVVKPNAKHPVML